jgi:methionine-rich copper-binding protein CopC
MLAASLVFPAWLSAHTKLSRSVPGSGAVVTQPPPEVRCWFSEPVEVRFSAITVVRAKGDPATGRLQPLERVDQGWQPGPNVTKEVAVTLPANLVPGVYLVQWAVLAVDGHRISGTFTWTYTPAAPMPGPQATPRGRETRRIP